MSDQWSYYRATLRHDHGRFRLTVFAPSEESARRMICAAEGCPERSILKVEKLKRRPA